MASTPLKLILLSGTVLFTVFTSTAEGKRDLLHNLVLEYHKIKRFNGTVLIAKDKEVVLKSGFGYANLEWEIHNQPDTKFLIASITKTFTAVLVMQLVEEGKVSLDTKLSEALPWYRKDTGDRVSIRQLLNHTSGIPNYFTPFGGAVGFGKAMGGDPINKEEFAKTYCQGDLEYEPGSKTAYNNSAYFLLGLIIERYTSTPYHLVLQEKIFDRVGMKHSGDLAHDPRQIVRRIASGYLRTDNGFEKETFWNMTTAYAAGSLYSTVEDLFLYDCGLYGDKLVSDKSKEVMFTPGLDGWGCGWELRNVPMGPNGEMRSIQTHEGFLFSWHTRMYRIPQERITVILFSNCGDSPLEQMFRGIADILYDRTPIHPKVSIAEVFDAEIRKNGIEKAVQLYRELRRKEFSSWDFGERELNTLGYRYLRAKLVPEAVAIFKLNVEAYPESANLFDSYGEGLAAHGQIDEAIKAYERAMALDSKTPNAKRMIAKLKAERGKW